MAKKKKSTQVSEQKTESQSTGNAPEAIEQGRAGSGGGGMKGFFGPQGWSWTDFKLQAVIVAALAFIFYINSAGNEFAHDDGIVIVKNEYVQEGFAGIGKILSRDAYDSYYKQLNTGNQLTGGRYRPLSIVTFAIEQQFFGAVQPEKIDSFLHRNMSYGVRGPEEMKLVHEMQVRHVMNVLWYMLLVVVVLYFLRYIVFPTEPLVALVATILFTIHPIHTEVVANVKSRDEIMSLLFMCLTFICAYKYQERKKMVMLALAMVSFFFAFMSKEYAITMVFLLPFSFFLFRNYTIKKSIMAFMPFLLVVCVYLYIRIKVAIITALGEDTSAMTLDEILNSIRHTSGNSEKEILNNPYYYATHPQKLATEISSSIYYIKFLLWPYPLSADYSYNSIPYKDFGSLSVYLSMIVHIGLAGLMVFFGFVKKNFKVLSFAIAFYLLHLLLVNNLVFDIGATLGERLIFHSSLGFAIAAAWLLFAGVKKIGDHALGMKLVAVLMLVLTIASAVVAMPRNLEWKSDGTLFAADIKVSPNSILVMANVAAAVISKADYEKDEKKKTEDLHYAISLLDKAIDLHQHTFVAGFLNRGIAWFKLGDIDKAKANIDSVKALYPNYPTLKGLYALLSDHYMRKGWDDYGRIGKFPEAIEEFKKGLSFDSTNGQLWYNLGGAYYSNHQLQEAVSAWRMSLKFKPDNPQAQQGMQAAMMQLQAMQPQTQKPAQKLIMGPAPRK